MFYKKSNDHYITAVSGVDRKTIVYGQNTLMSEFKLKKNSILPMHAHPQEQTGYLVAGRIRLILDTQVHDCEPGDSWCIPGDMVHGAEILEDSIAIEVFSPARKDYLPET
ncbi:MAG: cupin domain-containing protein [Desulfobacterales bacterium]|jgi:quercetin dioxygenase-like cupin family protein|nr:cupin domain-containing protein [Desulfobacterales bacterium]